MKKPKQIPLPHVRLTTEPLPMSETAKRAKALIEQLREVKPCSA